MLAKRKLLGEYRIGRTIGEGAFSKVKLATHKITNEKVAIKIIKKDDKEKEKEKEKQTGTSFLSNLSKEVKLLMRLEHPNVIKLHEVIDSESELYIIMEYASGGELIDYIAAKGSLSEKEGRRFFRQLVSAMDHCHLAGVIHRDLKLENMLLSNDKYLLLSDFGLGRTIYSPDQFLNTFCGTPLYAGPELVSGIKYVGPSADIWSLGIVLYIMISGKPPFKCDTISELYAQIKGVKYTCPPNFSPELRALLAKLLVRDPTKRATMDDIRNDTWVNLGEKEPPSRIVPKVIAANRAPGINLDDEIDKMVTNVQVQEGFTVYQFRKLDNLELTKSDESLNRVTNGSSTHTPDQLSVNTMVSAHGAGPDSPAIDEGYSSNAVSSKGRSRRGSLANALSRLNPFGSNGSPKSSNQKVETSTPPRGRSKSVAPGSTAYNAAATATSPTGNRVKIEIVTPEVSSGSPSTVLSKGRERRHSVATPQPVSVGGGHVRQLSAGKQRTESSRRGSVNTPAPPLLQPTSPIHESRHRSSMDSGKDKLGVPAPENAAGPRRRSLAPSMEQITEDAEASSSGQRRTTSNATRHAKPVISETTEGSHSRAHSRKMSISEVLGFGRSEGYGDELRTVRFALQLQSVQQKDPAQLLKQLESLLQNSYLFSTREYGEEGFQVEKRGKYVYACKYNKPTSGEVIFEIEIVRVWLLNMLAVKMKRLGGDAIEYKATYEKIVNALK